MKEQEEFISNDNKNNTEMGEQEEGGGQALNFKESPAEFEDDEEVVEDEQLEEGVKMIKMKDDDQNGL